MPFTDGSQAILERLYGRPICGAYMRQYGALCTRKPGHKHDCRSRYAMENARRARSGRETARLLRTCIHRGSKWQCDCKEVAL